MLSLIVKGGGGREYMSDLSGSRTVALTSLSAVFVARVRLRMQKANLSFQCEK